MLITLQPGEILSHIKSTHTKEITIQYLTEWDYGDVVNIDVASESLGYFRTGYKRGDIETYPCDAVIHLANGSTKVMQIAINTMQ